MLYLDTARLGRMSPRAQQAHFDFGRWAGNEGASFRFERFLRSGLGCKSEDYPGLSDWHGVANLKQSLRVLAGSRPDLPVLLANRSAQLMKLAARLLFHSCENVLMTDLGWPPYQEFLEAEARTAGRCVRTAPIRDAILRSGASANEVVEIIRKDFQRFQCDGLFLPSVSNLGPRLPVEGIVQAVTAVGNVRFVVVDGAQQFCHVSADIQNEFCDLYLAGCHKWLSAFHPMGLAFYGRRGSRRFIETSLEWLLRAGELDDPLLKFAFDLESGECHAATETVSLASLFSCQGAIVDALDSPRVPTERLSQRLSNLDAVEPIAAAAGWQPLVPFDDLRTGILLLQAEKGHDDHTEAETIRETFYDEGIALTAYPRRTVRLSMPDRAWEPGELDHLRSAFRATIDPT